MDLFSHIPTEENYQLQHSQISLYRGFLNSEQQQNLINHLWTHYHWEQAPITVFGKQYLTPRLTAWVAEQGINYGYSQVKHENQSWTQPLLKVKSKIENLIQFQFNSALLNAYRDGNDKMGWHQDNENALGSNPIIASLNLGATRRFDIRNITNPQDEIKLNLTPGSLLIMDKNCQTHYKHQVPQQKKENGLRVNLTFRKIFSDKNDL